MPKISLVVCLYKERDFLERLLLNAEGCYDDLVVVHDGREEKDESGKVETLKSKILYGDGWKSPEELSLKEPQAPPIELAQDYADLPADSPMPTGYRLATGNPRIGSIHELVVKYGGRFYEGPRCYQQEPHWPFAWWAAKHEWILRLDADEILSKDMQTWLKHFSSLEEPELSVSGFTCIWPPFDGNCEVTIRSPDWRPFLISKKRFCCLGLAEQGPIPDVRWKKTGLILHHHPQRKSYGVGNLIFRKQAYLWRKLIALSLLNTPLELPRWRWDSPEWPLHWEAIRRAPIKTGLKRAIPSFPRKLHSCIKNSWDFLPEEAIASALHQLLMPLAYVWFRRFKQ